MDRAAQSMDDPYFAQASMGSRSSIRRFPGILRMIGLQYSWRRHYIDRLVIFTDLRFNFTHFNGPLQSTEQNHRPSSDMPTFQTIAIFHVSGGYCPPFTSE